MVEKLDVPQVLEDLQAVVAKYGDGYQYEPPNDGAECVYLEIGGDGKVNPSCLVGHVLARHSLLHRQYAVENVALHGHGGAQTAGFYDDFTPEAVTVLAAAQEAQDNSSPWGDALLAAKQAAENLGR